MSLHRESIVRDALQLSEQERALVVQDLLSSLSPESAELLDDTWEEELDKRLANWEANPSSAIRWSELKTQR